MMLPDPRTILAAIGTACILLALGFVGGQHQASQAAAAREAAASAAAAQKLAEQTENEREKERLIARSLAAIADQHHQELTHAQQDRDRFIAGVRAGTIRLSIPIVADRAGAAGADRAAAGGDRHETRAELAPEAGITLATIADDGDDAIRQLNACIDAYNAVREAINVQAE